MRSMLLFVLLTEFFRVTAGLENTQWSVGRSQSLALPDMVV